MPPELFDVVHACPATKTWKTPGRVAEPDLAGARDRALLLVGFVAALRRSELAALRVKDVEDHANGLVLTLPRSKTNQTGENTELVLLPRATNPDRCPVTAPHRWMSLAGVVEGPVFRGVGKNNRATDRALQPGVGQHPRPGRHHPRQPGRHHLLRTQPARRVRHLRPPTGGLRPGHRPPDPTPLPGDPGHLGAGSASLD